MSEEIITNTVEDSAFFDRKFYVEYNKLDIGEDEAAAHYINEGEKQGFLPSKLFDPRFYLFCNPDLEQFEHNLLYHYIISGRNEARYCERGDLLSDCSTLLDAGFFDEKYYLSTFGFDSSLKLPPVGQYLANWRRGHRANEVFDDLFYYHLYPDVKKSRNAPAIHYVIEGRYQARVKNKKEYDNQYEVVNDHIDKMFYNRFIDEAQDDVDPAEHYLTVGKFHGARPTKNFSNDFYIRKYNDIRDSFSEPFVHFIIHGSKEGRIGIAPFQNFLVKGAIEFDYTKRTIIIANHEASRTGAPLVGLNIGLALLHKYNIITYIGANRGLEDDFKASSSLILQGPLAALDLEYVLLHLNETLDISAIIMNSVETDIFAKAAVHVGIPTIALIHEFAEYTMPRGRVFNIVKYVEKAIVPARIIERSIQEEMQAFGGSAARNIIIAPQGKLPYIPSGHKLNDLDSKDLMNILSRKSKTRNKIVLGAGFATIRKGIDLFVQTAHEVNKIRQDVAFVWCGGGYNPDKDPNYSIWVNEMISRMELESVITFIPEQSNLDVLLEAADIFYLSSRLDPYPNVIIDALAADKPIICFAGATGCAEIFEENDLSGGVVPHCDVVKAAEMIDHTLNHASKSSLNSEFVKKKLDFSNYIALLEGEISRSQVERNKIGEISRVIRESNIFQPDFYLGRPVGLHDVDNFINEYVASSVKNACDVNPRRGFSENLSRNNTGSEGDGCALAEKLERHITNGEPLNTHAAFKIASTYAGQGDQQTIALHVHMHYPDLAKEFADRFSTMKRKIDVYVTTNSEDALDEIRYHFRSLSKFEIKYYAVPNRGRDIGPLVATLSDVFTVDRYDVFGHFHGKKSLSTDKTMGENWRNFIFNTLIGNNDGTVDNIMNIFKSHENLGLIFAEDRHNVGWSKNLEFAQDLVGRLPSAVPLPSHPYFPLGTMFWARPKALAKLWESTFTYDDFPVEPAPYDGTILHALERMIPSLCEAEGYRWATVYKEGVYR